MDFLAIGDTAIDTFIRLKDAEVHCDVNNEHCMLSMRFGDKIPFEFAKVVPAVGNAANASVSASRLGLSSALLSWVGKDENGDKCLAALRADHVDTTYIDVETGKETNTHFVLWYGPERTILIKHEAFNYALPASMPAPRAVYLSSLGEAGLPLHDTLADWLERNPATLLAFQPGTFQMSAGMKRLERIYKRTNYFIANKEEYQRILASAEEDPKKLLDMMHAHGPKVCFLTDGVDGAYAYDGTTKWKMPVHPLGLHAYERTGAGDAFASTAVTALLLGKSMEEALRWAPINAATVAQKIGAQEGLLSRQALEQMLAEAPQDFAPTII